MKSRLLILSALSVLVAGISQAADGPTLAAVKQRGQLVCGSDGSRPGISAPDEKGVWSGLDVSFCRAISAAIFSDTQKVRFVPLSTLQRFPALQSGEVDVLSRVTTQTLTMDTKQGFDFSPFTLYTHTGIMVHKALNVRSAKELNGATICMPQGSATEKLVAIFFEDLKVEYKPLIIENAKELTDAYLSKRCDAMANFVPGLATIRAYQAPVPADHVLLPDVISKNATAIAVRQGDPQWRDIVNWAVYATFEAEERGITSKNVDENLKTDNISLQRFLGVSGDLGEKLGLPKDFAYQIVKKVGNYQEIWDATVGENAPLKMERGFNKSWKHGGLQYSPIWD